MQQYGTMPLNAFLANVRDLKIPIEYVKEDNGHWSCWTQHDSTDLFNTYGVGSNFIEAIDDYGDALKEIADCIYEDNLPEDNLSAEYLVKIMASPKEELRQCLNGKILEDS